MGFTLMRHFRSRLLSRAICLVDTKDACCNAPKYRPDVKQQDSNDPQAYLTISQTILFNFKKKGLAAGKSCH